MIKEIIKNALFAKRDKGDLKTKLSIFFNLSRLVLKKNQKPANNELVSADFYGYKVFSPSYFDLKYLFKEIFISNQYKFDSTKKNPLIVDCGANIGMSIIFFKKLYPEAHIIAFEANPNMYRILEKNVNGNSLKNVELHNIALYHEETEISFFSGSSDGNLLGSVIEEKGGTNHIKVKAKKLSDYLKNYDSIDVIKIDVEGAELNIIDDLIHSGSLQKANQYFIEYHHNRKENISNLSAFLQKFESNGYNYTIIDVNSYQDVLMHFTKR